MKVQLKDARLFFANNIFVASKPRTAAADAKLKYQLEVAIEPGSANHMLMKEALLAEANLKTGGKGAEKLKQIAVAGNMWALRDGNLRLDKDDNVRVEYEGKLVVSAKNEIRPSVFGGGPDGRGPIIQEDGKFYSGCFVNAIIDVKIGDKPKWQAYAYFLGVQFWRDGERIGPGVSAAEDFEPIPQAEEAKAAAGDGAAGLF